MPFDLCNNATVQCNSLADLRWSEKGTEKTKTTMSVKIVETNFMTTDWL